MKRVSLIITTLVILCFACTTESNAFTILEDWFGVTLTSDFVPGYTRRQFTNSWAPTKHTATADYKVDNWKIWWDGSSYVPGNQPSGGEIFDVEALYFDDSPTNIYIAIVTSFPSSGKWWHGQDLVIPGDIAMDLGGGTYDYGVNVADITSMNGGYVTGMVLGNGEVYDTAESDWFLANPLSSIPDGTEKSNFTGGTYKGLASYFAYYDYGLWENGEHTYVIEARINRALLGGLSQDQLIGLMWQMGCRNDWEEGLFRLDNGDIDHPYNPIPEPTSMLLLGMGVLGLFGVKRKT